MKGRVTGEAAASAGSPKAFRTSLTALQRSGLVVQRLQPSFVASSSLIASLQICGVPDNSRILSDPERSRRSFVFVGSVFIHFRFFSAAAGLTQTPGSSSVSAGLGNVAEFVAVAATQTRTAAHLRLPPMN